MDEQLKAQLKEAFEDRCQTEFGIFENAKDELLGDIEQFLDGLIDIELQKVGVA